MARGKLSHWSIDPILYKDFEDKVKELGYKRSKVVSDLLQLWITYIYPQFKK